MTSFVGSGDYRYELVPSWPKMPRHWSFVSASDGAVNSRDEVHVFSRGNNALTIWDPDGNFISSWGQGTFSYNEHGIFIAPNDNIWLVYSHDHIATEYTQDGRPLRTLGNKTVPAATHYGKPFNMPTGLAIAPNGEIFVSDGYGNRRVHKFSPDGELLLSWGAPGDGPGEFAIVHNIWVDKDSRVFTCDRENDRIQIFDDQGVFLEQWTDMDMPADLWIKDDVVYVVELGRPGRSGVSIWTLDGTLITRWRGDEAAVGGALVKAHGICVDSVGSIYVTELSPAPRVSKFQRV